MKELKPLSLNTAFNYFQEVSKSKLTLIEGLSDNSIQYLQLIDPSDIISDIVLISFVKDGDFYKEELSRPFTIWKKMEQNFVKLYQSENLMGNDGSTWFFALFKKRMLIQQYREVVDLSNETPLFDSKDFKNYF